jgi:hypothetical protein
MDIEILYSNRHSVPHIDDGAPCFRLVFLLISPCISIPPEEPQAHY